MRSFRLLTPTLLLLAACGEATVMEPDPDPALLNGSMRARIDGVEWRATSALAVAYTGGILAFAGADANSTTVGIGVIPNGPGSYPISPSQPTNANLSFGLPASWSATSHMGSGMVTITAMTANSATGTFSFTAHPVPNTNASGTKSVTEGVFDVRF